MRGQQVLLSGSLSHSHGSGSGVPVAAQVNEPGLLLRNLNPSEGLWGLYRGCVGLGLSSSAPTVGKQMEETMDNEMETGVR